MDYLNNLRNSFRRLRWYEWVMIAIMVVVAAKAMVDGFIDPSSSRNPPWLTVVNFVSAICGILCIFFTAKASVSCCIFGLINTLVYIVYLGYWNIYGTMCLEMFIYLPMNVVQWIKWSRMRDEEQVELTKTKRLTYRQDALIATVTFVSGLVYFKILEYVGGSVALLDAYTVSLGVIATCLSAFRYREQYILWLITDIIAVTMYIVMFDPVYLTKKSIYLVMAFVGIANWWRLNKVRNPENR